MLLQHDSALPPPPGILSATAAAAGGCEPLRPPPTLWQRGARLGASAGSGAGVARQAEEVCISAPALPPAAAACPLLPPLPPPAGWVRMAGGWARQGAGGAEGGLSNSEAPAGSINGTGSSARGDDSSSAGIPGDTSGSGAPVQFSWDNAARAPRAAHTSARLASRAARSLWASTTVASRRGRRMRPPVPRRHLSGRAPPGAAAAGCVMPRPVSSTLQPSPQASCLHRGRPCAALLQPVTTSQRRGWRCAACLGRCRSQPPGCGPLTSAGTRRWHTRPGPLKRQGPQQPQLRKQTLRRMCRRWERPPVQQMGARRRAGSGCLQRRSCCMR